MKNNGMTTILNWALIAGAVALCFSGIKFYNKSKTARTYRGVLAEVARFQQANTIVGGLMNDTLEYSKSHPEMKPLLDSIMKQAQPAKPAAK